MHHFNKPIDLKISLWAEIIFGNVVTRPKSFNYDLNLRCVSFNVLCVVCCCCYVVCRVLYVMDRVSDHLSNLIKIWSPTQSSFWWIMVCTLSRLFLHWICRSSIKLSFDNNDRRNHNDRYQITKLLYESTKFFINLQKIWNTYNKTEN